jgi:hypothetical protein
MGDGAEERVATDAGRGEGHRRVLCGGKRQIHILQSGRRRRARLAEVCFVANQLAVDLVSRRSEQTVNQNLEESSAGDAALLGERKSGL